MIMLMIAFANVSRKNSKNALSPSFILNDPKIYPHHNQIGSQMQNLIKIHQNYSDNGKTT